MGAPSVEKAETVVMDDGGWEGDEFGGGEDFGWELDWSSSVAGAFLESGEEAGCFGAPKKEVMEALALGFLAVELAMSAALRFRGVAILVYKVTDKGVESDRHGRNLATL